MDQSRVLVVGPTGQSGRAVVERLIGLQRPPRVLLRNDNGSNTFRLHGCEVVQGDVTKPATLGPALSGVDAVVLFLGVGHDPKTKPALLHEVEVVGGQNVIDAAVATGRNPRIVYLSAYAAGKVDYALPFMVKLETERALARSGLAHSILRPSNFIESIVGDFVQDGTANLAGKFPNPTSPISVHDIARVAVSELDRADPTPVTHDLFGPEAMTYRACIERWFAAIGEPVKFRSLPLTAFRLVARLASPFQPLLPVIASLVRSFNELDWSGDPARTVELAGGPLLTVEQAAKHDWVTDRP